MGKKRDAYVQKLKENIDNWNTQIDQFQIKADQASADAQVQYREQIEDLKAKRQKLVAKIAELQKARETAWQDVKTGVDIAWNALSESVKAARSRFN